MYTLFCQKEMGEYPPYPLTQQLTNFLKHPRANGVFVSPGFISRTDYMISTFLEGFLKENNRNLVTYFALGNQNDYIPEAGQLVPQDAFKKHEDVIKSQKIEWLDIDRSNASDHRKMVFIFQVLCDPEDFITNVTRSNYADFLNQIDILAVAIGSSNFSYKTYSLAKSINTFKALECESDILMFKDDVNDQFVQDYVNAIVQESENNRDQQYRLVLSRSVTCTPPDFLKKIFKESLEMILKK